MGFDDMGNVLSSKGTPGTSATSGRRGALTEWVSRGVVGAIPDEARHVAPATGRAGRSLRSSRPPTRPSVLTRRPATVAAVTLLFSVITWNSSGNGKVAAQGGSCLVTTANGNVQGVLRGGTCTYLGVPYAAPPIGNLRWRPPQPQVPWAPATLNLTAAAPACPQYNLAGAAAGNEDCLTLNVWAPNAPASGGLPVLVWLHPGSFLAASSNLAAADGRRFAEERGAVVVHPNYRLGPFGFLAHAALTLEDRDYRSSGNYGLADQRATLGWCATTLPASVVTRRASRSSGRRRDDQHQPAPRVARQPRPLPAGDHAQRIRDRSVAHLRRSRDAR